MTFPSDPVLRLRCLTAIGALALAVPAHAAIASYYVGVDTLQNFATGTYAGQANPNFGRLTMLYAHPNYTTPSGSHYHSKGVYTLTGPAGSPTITTSTSNYLPEGTVPPITLTTGTGLYGGKLVSNPYTDTEDPGYHFSLLTLLDTQSLAGSTIGSAEQYLYNSSSDRWTGAIGDADVHLTLVGLSAGLHVGDAGSLTIGLETAGDDFHLGESINFTPVFWVDGTAAPGTYTATFKLTDESDTLGESGNFEYRFTVVPEPSSVLLLGGAALAGLLRRKRR